MDDNYKEDDSLERFFKNKASEYKIPYREEDWLKLEKKLDIRDMRSTYQTRIQWIAAASILIAMVLGYFTFDNHQRLNEASHLFNHIPSVENHQNRQGIIHDDTDMSRQSDDPADTPLVISSREPEVVQLDGATTDFSAVIDDNSKATHSAGTSSSEYLAIIGGDNLLYRSEIHTVSQVADLNDSRGFNVEPLIAKHDDINSEKVVRERVKKSHPLISAGIVMAPDLTTVGSLSNFYDPGYKLGINVEYTFRPNLSISIGAIQSRLRYRASGADSNPYYYFRDGITPDETLGECLLIDLPINLKYEFLNLSNSRFYLTSGVSSYIMLTEDYRFNYESNGYNSEQGWSGNTGTVHLLSNAGFSVGYELDVHPNWSIRAEPFIRIPLREVGWGNVKLYSLGSFVSFNYNLRAN